MYYQYGYFKPLAAKKTGRVGTTRQVVPAVFVFVMSLSLILSPLTKWMGTTFLLGLASYFLVVLVGSAAALRSQKAKVALLALLTFPVVHFSYGFGSLRGLFDFVVRQLPGPGNPHSVPMSR
jgi:hypothetical protein